MNIFAKSQKAIRDFDTAMKTAYETHAEAKKNIMANYAGNLMGQKLAEINETLQAVEMEQKAAVREALAADFADAKAKINAMAVADAPGDFISTLEAIKTVGASLTDYEIRAYLEKYRTSYIAARAIAEEMGKHSNGKFTITRPDQLADDVAKVHGQLVNWLQSWTPNSYMSRLMVADVNILTGLDDKVQAWLDGGFVHVNIVN